MRIVITGGAGFIGSHLGDRFLAEGHQVVALDNLITGSLANIEHNMGNPNFEFIHHDVSNFIHVKGDVDVVMHFASPASPIDYLKYPIQTLKVGAMGTHNALGLARAKGARFVLASTSEIYGDPLEHPQKESYAGNVDPIGPRGVYDEAKRYAEALVMAYHRYHDLETRIVRIFNTYGPRMRLDDGRVVPNFIGQAIRNEPLTVYGDGAQTRCFQYVDDLVEGVYRLLNSDFSEPVNIGTTREISIKEFAEIVNKVADSDAGIIYKEELRIQGDPQTRQPDNTRAREILGWEPVVPLEEGLKKTIAYFRKVS
ncbi:SDR family oxidoreductase [Phototrophicus methaneseepsis]|uniref:UDP-glucuronate decarboxylase n=1 Tax=Phototrophicus methaneseepsis TaxID=2710758 RepID=A0A7S8IDV0_9CHLR|nr:UDP-glucuronic acid decarboxylase family protein [Phototrophicus methaneseepsis]QPC81193.1 SDR family oxidoreductase [Phototrophicus methaneseepsis]